MKYLELLKHSFEVERDISECPPQTRLEYLSKNIFDFTTYDGEKDDLFGLKAVEVCEAISNKQTYEYIEQPDNYIWYLVMCNMPFFAGRLEWGSSIRGAWWAGETELDSCGLWVEDRQLTETLKFSAAEWKRFVDAVIEFAREA